MNVVVAVEDAARSQPVIKLAAREATCRQVGLVAVAHYSAERRIAGAPAALPVSTLRTSQDDRDAAEAMLRDAVFGALGDKAEMVRLRVASGQAGKTIVDAAKDTDAELIVIGMRPSMAMVPGTTAQFVLRNAPCPVLVVPPTTVS
jgi:nucleotide-binding universal stress UspA family protein